MAQETRSVAAGMALSAENVRKFGFDAAAATRITAKLVSLPPPVALLQMLGVSDDVIKEVVAKLSPPEGSIGVPGVEMMQTVLQDIEPEDALGAATEGMKSALESAQAFLPVSELPEVPTTDWPPPDQLPDVDEQATASQTDAPPW